MTEFTPVASTIGGLLIGAASAAMLLLNGRITGISGMLGGLLAKPSADDAWRAAFLGGLVVATVLLAPVMPIAVDVTASPVLIIAAGLLVGAGTTLGSGCTSGHGICGLSRGSPRSIASVATFMAVAGLTLYVVRHLLGWI